jgi:uncharacterized sulfatase
MGGGGLAYSLLRKPTGPGYPAVYSNTVRPLATPPHSPPNIILINADDLGYGDLSCYGSTAIQTPNIDGLARDGIRFTDFHACDAVCTPSRAGLLTGRYPARMMLDTPLQPGGAPLSKRALLRLGYLFGRMGLLDLASRHASEGIHEAEITLAEALRVAGYRTGMVGKWHLGDFAHDSRFHPLRHGFDWFLGVPYSNDMHPFPLFRGEELVEAEVEDQASLTGLYTSEALDFIRSSDGGPFFLYFAHTFPHRPLFVSDDFAGRSTAGLYGDVVQEIDWSVGRVLQTLEELGLAQDTWVLFTSDNGPWYQGSAGPLRGRKGQAFEGGHRVPLIARIPGRTPPGSECHALSINLDLFPTLLAVAGLALPEDRLIDGRNITSLLTGESHESPHEYLYLYHQGELEGVRWGRWKYLRSTSHYTWPMPVNKKLGGLTEHTSGPLPLLHDLSSDPGEAYNLADRRPDLVNRLEGAMRGWEEEMASNPIGFFSRDS